MGKSRNEVIYLPGEKDSTGAYSLDAVMVVTYDDDGQVISRSTSGDLFLGGRR